jgi:hypothetical protein
LGLAACRQAVPFQHDQRRCRGHGTEAVARAVADRPGARRHRTNLSETGPLSVRRDKKASAEAGQIWIISALPVTRNIRFDIVLLASCDRRAFTVPADASLT